MNSVSPGFCLVMCFLIFSIMALFKEYSDKENVIKITGLKKGTHIIVVDEITSKDTTFKIIEK